MVSSEPVWAEDMAVEWQEYAPAPPVRIEVGPARKRNRVEPQAVCGDRPLDVIPQPAGAPALPAPVSDDHEMGLGAGAPALPTPVNEEDDKFFKDMEAHQRRWDALLLEAKKKKTTSPPSPHSPTKR